MKHTAIEKKGAIKMQPQVLTNEVTELTKMKNDINQPNMSLGLGSSAPVQDLDEDKEVYDIGTQQLDEDKEIYDIGMQLRELERLEEENEYLKQYYGNKENYYKEFPNETKENVRPWEISVDYSKLKSYDQWLKELDEKIAKNNTSIYNINNDKRFDNRTDEQRREDKYIDEERERLDSSYQRTVEDMKKAGLNPMFMQGTNAAGSIGQMGGSKSESDEEKKKKRRAELLAKKEEARRAKQKETQMVLGFITSMAETAAKVFGK